MSQSFISSFQNEFSKAQLNPDTSRRASFEITFMINQVEKEKLKKNLKLEGKAAIVTGAASGIGKSIAVRFAQEGAKVAIVDINLKGAQKVASEIQEKDGEAIAINADVGDPRKARKAIDEVIRKWNRINILVNNAGISKPVDLLDKNARRNWDEVIDTNLHGAFNMTEAVAKQMEKHDYQGSIINITSVHSQVPGPKGSGYVAAKAGLVGATKCWALNLAPLGIRVNAIAPGAIRSTGMNKAVTDKNDKKKAKKLKIPLGRHGLPKEIADAAVFLATNQYITSQEIFVDGGFILTH